ncbi:MAG: ABC transporter ATP-binding protein [Acidimicrobiales bacterium]
MKVLHDAVAGIQASGLTKSYGPLMAVRGIDVSIAPGETVALLGPNGAGKSTTIDMILGLTSPDGGTVEVFGREPKAAVRAGSVGAMLQTGSLVAYLSVRELVSVVASLYPRPLPVDEVLELTGTADLAGRPTSKLSGGQTQRVRFAIALVGDPDLLVLDEPTAAIDVEGRRDFWEAMHAIARRGKTVLFATHYLEEADAYADRVVVMARGQVVADGSPAAIRAKAATRTIRASAPGLDITELGHLPGVSSAERLGDQVVLSCADADAALYHLLGAHPGLRDIEVRGAGIEEAFLELTGNAANHDEGERP